MIEKTSGPEKHFEILELDQSASPEEARQAYRDLIAVWHPDRYTHNSRLQQKALEKMKAVNSAYEFVSRFIVENGTGQEHPPKSKPGRRPAPADYHRDTISRETGRSAAWARTEARLAVLARAKETAKARQALQAEAAARMAAEEEKKRAAAKKARIEAERQGRMRAKEAEVQAKREKEDARKRAWEQTEKRLRALKGQKKKPADAERANAAQKQRRGSIRSYLRQLLTCGGIVFIGLAANTLQTAIHFSFTHQMIMIGTGFIAWGLITKFSASRPPE